MRELILARNICVAPGRTIEHGALLLAGGLVEAAGAQAAFAGLTSPEVSVRDVGERTVVPAPINCHTHLELSHCAGRTVQGRDFLPWLESLLATDMNACDQGLVRAAVEQLAACGTAHVADICSRAPGTVARALEGAGVGYTLCAENFGFAPLPDGARPLPQSFLDTEDGLLRHVAAAGHALYSTSPQRMCRAREWSLERNRPFALHLAENSAEVELLTTGGGAMAQPFRNRVLPKGWRHPEKRPVAYARELGLLGTGTLAVHCVHLAEDEIALLAESGSAVCLCPRSNVYIGVGQAPVEELLRKGALCCLGTDSLASNYDLDIWNEVRCLLRSVSLSLSQALELTSYNGAKALQLPLLGSLEPGKQAAWTLLPEDLETSLG